MKKIKLFRHEATLLLKLTGPILLAQLSQTSMGFVDTVMAGRVGPVDLAAVAVGSSLFFPIFLFLVLTLEKLQHFQSEDISKLHKKCS